MTFEVRFSRAAEDDLERLFDFLLERAQTAEDLEFAQSAVNAIRAAASGHLALTPFSFRKVGASPLRRELIIPFGASGYVALYEIDADRVIVLAVRHQLEGDYH